MPRRLALLPLLALTGCGAAPLPPPPAPEIAVTAAPPPPLPLVTPWLRPAGRGARNQGRAVAIDATGNVLVAGNSGDHEGFVTKLGRDGAAAWTCPIASPGVVAVNAVATDAAGNVYLAGGFTGSLTVHELPLAGHERSDVFVAKLDPQGAVLWGKAFGGTSFEAARGLAVDDTGNVYLTGTYQRDLDFGGGVLDNGGVYDVFVAELDGAGRHLMSRGFHADGGTETTGVAIALDASSVYVAGRVDHDVDFGGGRLPRAGGASLFALKLARDGRHVWSRLFGGRGDAQATAIAPDASGGAVVAGSFYDTLQVGGTALASAGGRDAVVLRLDAGGAPLWSKRFGGTGSDEARGVAVTAAGDVYVAAAVEDRIDLGAPDPGRGRSDAVLIQLDGQGALRWLRRYGAGGADAANGVALHPAHGLALAGAFAETLDGGLGTLTSRGAEDAFVLRWLGGEPPLVTPPKVEIATEPRAAEEQAMRAAERGDVAILEALVPARVPATAADANGWSLVMKAAYKGQVDAVKYLLSKGGNPDTALPSGYNALMQAARWGYLDAVRALIEGGANPNLADAKLGTVLHIAVSDGRKKPEVAAYLMAHGAKLEERDGRARTPLFVAIDAGNDEGARALLDAKAKLEAADKDGNTPLAWAAVKGNAAMATELLKRGAKPDAANGNGMTPVFHAAHGGHAAIVEALLGRGASANVKEKKFGDTALMRAAGSGHLAVVELLLGKGAKPNEANHEGLTAAHQAARNGQDAVLRALALHKASFRLKDKEGRDVATAAGSRTRTAELVRSLTK